MLLLVAALVSIIGAGSRDGFLDPGQKAGPKQSLRARVAMVMVALLLIAVLYLGNGWWNAEASTRATNMIYKPPPLAIDVSKSGYITLRIGESKWHSRRGEVVMTSLIPDHGHLMHLFLLRIPQMDCFYHLHPSASDETTFTEHLPAMPAGHYQLFADIVRASGFPDTMTAEIDIPDLPGTPPEGMSDDSSAVAPALPDSQQSGNAAPLPGGASMVWERDAAPIHARQPMWFRFHVEDQAGKQVHDLEPYMGMAGHAEFVSFDQKVFAHVHPDGSVTMAALSLANPSAEKLGAMADMANMSSEVSFPYGFPKPGGYRMFIQVKRAGQVQTGTFDVNVVE